MNGVMSFSKDKHEKFLSVLSVIQKRDIKKLKTETYVLEKN